MHSRFMLRLIDLALIILMGFIAISRLRTEYVDLPSAGDSNQQIQTPHEAFLYVTSDQFNFEDDGRKWNCKTLNELERFLISQNNAYLQRRVKLVVTIEPKKPCIMQNLVDVLDICQRNKIEKNLDYENYN